MSGVPNLDLVLLIAAVIVLTLLIDLVRSLARHRKRDRISRDRERWGSELEGRRYIGSRKD